MTMRAAILVVGCLMISSSTLAADQQADKTAPIVLAKRVVVASAAKPAHKPVRSTTATADFPARVWTLEMSCCEPQ
jgi:hypothetical protein